MASTIILLIMILSIVGYYKKLIPIRYEKNELVGENYQIVIEKLTGSGFNNLEINKISNLKSGEEKEEYLVTDVIIENKSKFTKETKIMPDTKITIIYRTYLEIFPPVSSKEAKNKKYKDIEKQFKSKGFTNVKLKPIYDVIIGIINQDGEVDKITINGKEKYDTSSKYKSNAEIVIYYHTLKKNKK